MKLKHFLIDDDDEFIDDYLLEQVGYADYFTESDVLNIRQNLFNRMVDSEFFITIFELVFLKEPQENIVKNLGVLHSETDIVMLGYTSLVALVELVYVYAHYIIARIDEGDIVTDLIAIKKEGLFDIFTFTSRF